MSTYAIPAFSGRPASNSLKASRPPAEAPIPTMGKDSALEGSPEQAAAN